MNITIILLFILFLASVAVSIAMFRWGWVRGQQSVYEPALESAVEAAFAVELLKSEVKELRAGTDIIVEDLELADSEVEFLQEELHLAHRRLADCMCGQRFSVLDAMAVLEMEMREFPEEHGDSK